MKAIMIYPNEINNKNMHEIFSKLNRHKFTDIFYITKNIDGSVFYKSHIAEGIEDRLEDLCKISAKFGINVYSWFCTFTEGYMGKLYGKGMSNFLKNNPECSAVNSDGENTIKKPVFCDGGLENYACPANKKTQEYELKLIKEIINNYPIRGLLLDFIRYPFPGEYCYCSYCVNKFNSLFGINLNRNTPYPKILRWKQYVIENFTNTVYKTIKDLDKETQLAALVWKYDDCLEKSQDWKNWSIDFAVPMLYHKSYKKDINWIEKEAKKNKIISKKELLLGVGGPYSSLFTKKEWNNINLLLKKEDFKGLIYGHYGLNDVLSTLDGGYRINIRNTILWNSVNISDKILAAGHIKLR